MWRDRLRTLAPFLVTSYALAIAQWALSPKHIWYWWPSEFGRPDNLDFPLTFFLAIAWIVVVVRGFKKCGWPGLIMLPSAIYGLFPFGLYIALITVCAMGGDCL